MVRRFPPVNSSFPHFLHGGDYNPDQWRSTPSVWEEDVRLMKLASFNAPSIGIFAWGQIEVEEGRFEFDWLDRVLDLLEAEGVHAIMSTPSAAPPPWLFRAYPEVLRVNPDRTRQPHEGRVNFCLTSDVYREKCRIIDTRIAERVRDRDVALLWHVNNEMAGTCHCEQCQAAFRLWLQARHGSLDALNEAWWTAFWSHTYTDWAEIESPTGRGALQGLQLDWKRFSSDQQFACYKNESDVLHAVAPGIPVTTNTWRGFGLMDWRPFAAEMDVASSDCYPHYQHQPGDWKLAPIFSFNYDVYRSMKGGQPFVLMETTPSSAFMFPSCKLKRPGMHQLACLQAVAHGSDSVCYFQWRMGRGGAEKFHGAVVSHDGHENTRVFREVSELGDLLTKLDDVVGTTVRPEVAIIHDQEVNWILDDVKGHLRDGLDYPATCVNHYRPFWERGIPVDVVHMDTALSGYRLVVAPMLTLLRPGVAERIERFVADGGTFVATYYTGLVDERDLCFLGGFPGPLRKVLGVWVEETDALDDGQMRLGQWLGDLPMPERRRGTNSVIPVADNPLGLAGEYEARHLCDLIHPEGAETLATYGGEFYAGRAALTVNRFGQGNAYYIASRNDEQFHRDFYGALATQLGIQPVLDTQLPEGVTAQTRTDGERTFVFLLNFALESRIVLLPSEVALVDMRTREELTGDVTLEGCHAGVYEKKGR